MTNDEAMKLARLTLRAMQHEQSAVSLSWADVRALCDHILSGSMKRGIENAAFERAGGKLDKAASDSDHSKVARAAFTIAARFVRELIQPPAQQEDGNE